ncbi:MAG: aspartate 1-decarboxylase [candidate division Zixibacteria bacterium]|nr:aspartate 1-decarboxylase [candidate division Zixibacteria bacterium]MDH3935974.1 aspartate 1-decarboxylase [candidate division Zixibacteria bacterium]MDH4032708.1 aspartate 1-decarboxylase [candidate division Zixibacteria bacterium]
MLITVCKSKIHRATITDANLDYVGSITIDSELMGRADLVEFEKVQVANIANGERFETYVIEGKADSGTIGLNGAAARKGSIGDLIIIIAYGHLEKGEAELFKPAIVHVDKDNRPVD